MTINRCWIKESISIFSHVKKSIIMIICHVIPIIIIIIMDLRPMVMFLYMLSAKAYTCGGFSYVACTCPCIMIYYDKPNEDSTDDDNIIMLPLSVTKYISLIFRIKFIFSWLTAPWYMSTSLFVKYFISCKILHFSFFILQCSIAMHCIVATLWWVLETRFSFLGNALICHHCILQKNWCFSPKPSGFWVLFQVSMLEPWGLPLPACWKKKRTFKCLLTGGNVSSVISSQLL